MIFRSFCHFKSCSRAGIKLKKVKKQQYTPNFCSAILDKEENTYRCGKVIQMTTGYFLTWQTSYHSFPSPALMSKLAAVPNFPPGDVQDVKFLSYMRFTKFYSRGLPPTSSSWGHLLIGAVFEIIFLLSDGNFLVINVNCYISLSNSTKSCCCCFFI